MVTTNKYTVYDGEIHSILNNQTFELYKEFSWKAKQQEKNMIFSGIRERYVNGSNRRYRETLSDLQNNFWRTFCEIHDYEDFCKAARKAIVNTHAEKRRHVIQRVVMLNLKARPQGWKELFTKPSSATIKLLMCAKVWPLYKEAPDDRNRLTVKLKDPAFNRIKLVFNTDEKLHEKYLDGFDQVEDVKVTKRRFERLRKDKVDSHYKAFVSYIKSLPKNVRFNDTLPEMACPENQHNRAPEDEDPMDETDDVIERMTRYVEEEPTIDIRRIGNRVIVDTDAVDQFGNVHLVRLNFPDIWDWTRFHDALDDLQFSEEDSLPTDSGSEMDIDEINWTEGINVPDLHLTDSDLELASDSEEYSSGDDIPQPENQGFFDKINEAKEKLNKVVDTSEKVGQVAAKMDMMLDTLKNAAISCFNGVKDVGNIIVKLTPFFLAFYQLHMLNWDLALAWPTIANMALNLVSMFGDGIVASVRGCVASICTMFQKVKIVEEAPKSESGDSAEPVVKVPTKAFKFLGKLVSATVTGGDTCLRKVIETGKKIKGVWETVHYGAKLFDIIKDSVISGLNWAYKKAFGRPLPMLETQFDSDYEKWTEEIKTQVALANRQSLMTEVTTQETVERLYLESYPLLVRGLKIKGPAFSTPFNLMRQTINNLWIEVRAKAIQKGESRPEPVSVLIYGKPGCGKSFFQTEIAKALVHLEKKIPKSEVNIDRDVYYKKMETGSDQYITGYIDQLIFCIDDLGAVNDTQANPNLDYVHIMGMVGTLPYCFPSASLAEKGQIFFKSSYLLLTSNISYHRPPSLFSHEAVNRRFKYVIYLYLKPEFADDKGKLDPEKAKKSRELPWEIYLYMSGENVPSYDSGIKPSPQRKVSIEDLVKMVYDRRQANVAVYNDLKDNNFSCFPKDYSGYKPNHMTPIEMAVKSQDIKDRIEKVKEKHEKAQKLLNNGRPKGNAQKVKLQAEVEVAQKQIDQLKEALVKVEVTEQLGEVVPEPQGNDEEGYTTCSDGENKPKETRSHGKSMMAWHSKLLSLASEIEQVECLPPTANAELQFQKFHRVAYHMQNEYRSGALSYKNNFPVKSDQMFFIMSFIESKMTTKQKMRMEPEAKTNLDYMLTYSVPRVLFAGLIAYLDREVRDARRNCFDNGVFAEPFSYCAPVRPKPDGKKSLWQRHLEDVQYTIEESICFYYKYQEAIYEGAQKALSYLWTGLIVFVQLVFGWMAIRWMLTPVKPENQISPYDAQPPSARARRPMPIKIASPESATDPDFENTVRVLSRNLYCLYMVKQQGGTPFYASQILGVKGKCFLFTRHDAERMREMYEILLVRKGHIWARTTDTKNIKFIPAKAPDGTYLDSGLVVLKGVNDNKDITNKFITEEDLKKLNTMYIALLKVCPGLDENTDLPPAELRTGFCKPIVYTHIKEDGESVLISRAVRYTIPTFKGDCVSPAIVRNAAVQRKVIGHHTAGLDGMGYANIITQETLQAMYPAVDQSCCMSFDPEEVVETPNRVWIYPVSESVDALEEENELEGNVMPIGNVTSTKGASVSKITDSIANGTLERNGEKVKPVRGKAVLFKPGRSMLGESLQKVIQNAPFLDEQKAELVLDVLFEKFAEDMDSYSPKRFLNTFEAFHGVDGDEYLKPMNRKTSNGWPEVMMVPKNSRGKEYYLGKEDNRFVHQYLVDKMEENIQRVSKMERPVFVFQDCLKDELRPLPKVEKPRAFSIGNICFTGFTRKFLLPFCAFIMRNRVKNGIAVGIDAHTEWGLLNEHLRVNGPHCFDGDIGKFDGSISHNLLMKICEKVIEFLRKVQEVTEEDANCIRVIFASIANSVHVCNGKVYVWGHSEPSGNPLTAYINSIITIVYLGIAWQIIFEETEYEHPIHFFEHCTFVTYGDDHVVNVTPSAAVYYNQQTVAKALATIGIEYTTAEKDAAFYETKPLEDCIFLKRHCGGFTEYGRLNYDLVWDMVLWSKKGKNDIETFLQTVTAACTEMALHGRHEYEMFVKELRKVMNEHKIEYAFKPFSYYLFQRGHCVYNGDEL